MPDLEWNKGTWDGSYDWTGAGDEWSGPWGSSKAQWYATILPRIGAFLPRRAILEIAPGFGRWTQFLLPHAQDYRGIDLSAKCVAACRQRFAAHSNAQFFQNDGRSLDAVRHMQFDLVFSYDSLVHADFDAIAPYVEQIVPLLSEHGVAFIHHSNLHALPGMSTGHRSESVSAELMAGLVQRCGGRVLIQERVAWCDDVLSDCYSMFCRAGAYANIPEAQLGSKESSGFEAANARERFAHYLSIASD